MAIAGSCPQAQVEAIFEESTLRFEVAFDTPLERLCMLRPGLGKGHGEPLRVEITLPENTAANWRCQYRDGRVRRPEGVPPKRDGRGCVSMCERRIARPSRIG